MGTNTTSVGAISYNLPDLKSTEGDVLALEIFQIVEEVKAHLLVTKQEMVSEPSSFFVTIVRCHFPEYNLSLPYVLFTNTTGVIYSGIIILIICFLNERRSVIFFIDQMKI
jgi:hypothetical protein